MLAAPNMARHPGIQLLRAQARSGKAACALPSVPGDLDLNSLWHVNLAARFFISDLGGQCWRAVLQALVPCDARGRFGLTGAIILGGILFSMPNVSFPAQRHELR